MSGPSMVGEWSAPATGTASPSGASAPDPYVASTPPGALDFLGAPDLYACPVPCPPSTPYGASHPLASHRASYPHAPPTPYGATDPYGPSAASATADPYALANPYGDSLPDPYTMAAPYRHPDANGQPPPVTGEGLAPGTSPHAHQPTSRGTGRRKVVLAALAGMVLVSLLGLGFAFFGVKPWLSRPTRSAPAISEDFAKVERWARVSKNPPKNAEVLAGAATLVARLSPRIRDGEVPAVADASLSVEERSALDALVRWHGERGGFVSSCVPRGDDDGAAPSTGDAVAAAVPQSPTAYLTLGALALATSRGSSEDRNRLEAALGLADILRTRGSVAEYATGARLAVMAAQWVKARKYKVTGSFEAHRPRTEQLRTSLARDAVCVLQRLGSEDGLTFSARDFLDDDGPRPPFGLLSPERERLVLKDFVGEWLVATKDAMTAQDLADGFTAMVAPASVVLRAAVPTSAELEAIAKDHAEYDRLIPPQRSGSQRSSRSSERRARQSSRRRPNAPNESARDER
ncbi:MAG: hypothetical protein JW751_22625 [Polyangiaceae bacterium]|nr:hypothetical protein [Polyangiaceae bacterium]